METNNDKHLDIEKEDAQYQQGDQETERQKERSDKMVSHQDVGDAQSTNSGSDIGVKEKEKRQKIINLAYWIMIAVVIVTCCFVIYYITSNAHSCLADPLKFYSSKIQQECYCMSKLFP